MHKEWNFLFTNVSGYTAWQGRISSKFQSEIDLTKSEIDLWRNLAPRDLDGGRLSRLVALCYRAAEWFAEMHQRDFKIGNWWKTVDESFNNFFASVNKYSRSCISKYILQRKLSYRCAPWWVMLLIHVQWKLITTGTIVCYRVRRYVTRRDPDNAIPSYNHVKN